MFFIFTWILGDHLHSFCRLESVRAVLANGIAEDPLESEEQLQEQMDSLPYMCRFQYEYAVELIVGRMDPIVAAYQKVLPYELLLCPFSIIILWPSSKPWLCTEEAVCMAGWNRGDGRWGEHFTFRGAADMADTHHRGDLARAPQSERLRHTGLPPPQYMPKCQSCFCPRRFNKRLSKPHMSIAVLTARVHGCIAQETIDGDLAVRVFGLLQMVDSGFHQSRYGERSRQRLDIAILSFFQSFRKVYVGEQVMHSSKVSSHPTIPPVAHMQSMQTSLHVAVRE